MNMDSKDKKNNHPFSSLLKSFSFAICGFRTAVREERNMRIHLTFSIIVITCSFAFSLSAVEWMFVIIAIGGMFALELINSAIERLVDLITNEYHPLAKQAKDFAAGAVFVYAVTAAAIGIILFLPHVVRLFK